MKKLSAIGILFAICFVLTACAGTRSSEVDLSDDSGSGYTEDAVELEDSSMDEEKLKLSIGNSPVEVTWENNESVDTLMELVKAEPLTIKMSMYGGFEQVGSIGTSLPRDDEQTTTSAGDIVLYSGNQIVVFYGSNTWAYTRLGKITDKDADEMAELLGNGDVEITIEMEE